MPQDIPAQTWVLIRVHVGVLPHTENFCVDLFLGVATMAMLSAQPDGPQLAVLAPPRDGFGVYGTHLAYLPGGK